MPATNVLDVTRKHDGQPRLMGFASNGDAGTDPHSFTMPAGHVFNSCSLQVTGGKQNPGVRLEKVPSPGSDSGSQIDVRWYFDGGIGQSFVEYKLIATTIPRAELRPAKKVRGFLPSSSGFHFQNNFTTVSVSFTVGPVTVPLAGANGGACGGMAFATRDLFEAGFLVPNDDKAPSSGALYNTIMDRLRDSFNLPTGPQRYTELMDPGLRDAAVPLLRGRSDILREAWSQIRSDIDNGKLSAVGLVLLRSNNPLDIANNHQVLAYGYTYVSDHEGLIFLYDPNFQNDNTQLIAFKIEPNDTVSMIDSSYPGLVGFFRNTYTPAVPNRPPLGTTKKVAFKASNGKYVVAEDAGGGIVNANRDVARSWEKFTIERTNDGDLKSGELVNIKTSDGQHYLVAIDGGGGAVKADRSTPLSWERFVIEGIRKADGTALTFGDPISTGATIAIRTDGDSYLTAVAGVLKATASSPDASAEFVIEFK